ncbi:MAG: hypothetical protein AAF593_01265 [Planctomycetota bacterium]
MVVSLEQVGDSLLFFDGSGQLVTEVGLMEIRGSKARLGVRCDHLIVQRSSFGRELQRDAVERFNEHGRSAGLLVVRDAASRKVVKR